ncbi:MAG: LPS assembly protein LptD [Candidatus Omnitrophica bacterium]|nr:LPS assembly protein LptD [Candidatus Omnitrophota bacterium]
MSKKHLLAFIIFLFLPGMLYAIEPTKEPLPVPEKTVQKTVQEFKKSLSDMAPTAEELQNKESATPIIVNGDKVQYDYANKMVTGTGNVSITYKDVKLTCDTIVVNIDQKEGVAEGNVTLYQEGNTFTSDKVVYNFATKKGELDKGAMNMPPWYGKAQLIEKVDDKLFVLRQSYITTCDLTQPHYRVEAKTIKIYLNDRVTAWHVFFLIGNVPVMYVPYYNHPLKDNMPQVDIVPGYDKDWGAYALTAWRYYFHPDSKGHIHLDYRTRRGLGTGVDYNYGLRKFGKGYIRFYYTHDLKPSVETDDNRWRVQVRHRWEVDQNSVMTGEFHKLSDKDLIKDFFYKEEYEIDNQPPTYLSYVGGKDNYSFSVLAEKKVNDFFTSVERLPEAKMSIRKLKILNFMNLYYQDESSVGSLKKSFLKDVPGAGVDNDYDSARVDSKNELSYPMQVFGFLSINPFVGTRQTYYSKAANMDSDVMRNFFNVGSELYTRFYKVYDVETDYLGLDIHDIRHLIMPSARYEYITTPNYSSKELWQFDEIDTLYGENGVKLTLENKLQTKRTDEGGSKNTIDLLTFIADTKYMIKDDRGNENELMDVNLDLEIRPYDWMFFKGDAKIDTSEHRLDNANADIYFTKGEGLDFGLGYRYEWAEIHDSSQITSQLTYRINKDWKFRIYERYEIRENQFQQQEYTIYKDLHCWTGEVTCRIKEQRDFTFWVVFRLKAFPDMPFLFRTTYKGPEPGNVMQH